MLFKTTAETTAPILLGAQKNKIARRNLCVLFTENTRRAAPCVENRAAEPRILLALTAHPRKKIESERLPHAHIKTIRIQQSSPEILERGGTLRRLRKPRRELGKTAGTFSLSGVDCFYEERFMDILEMPCSAHNTAGLRPEFRN